MPESFPSLFESESEKLPLGTLAMSEHGKVWREASAGVPGNAGTNLIIVGEVDLELFLLMRVARADRQRELVGDVENIMSEQRPVVAGLVVAVVEHYPREGRRPQANGSADGGPSLADQAKLRLLREQGGALGDQRIELRLLGRRQRLRQQQKRIDRRGKRGDAPSQLAKRTVDGSRIDAIARRCRLKSCREGRRHQQAVAVALEIVAIRNGIVDPQLFVGVVATDQPVEPAIERLTLQPQFLGEGLEAVEDAAVVRGRQCRDC